MNETTSRLFVSLGLNEYVNLGMIIGAYCVVCYSLVDCNI